MRIQHNILAMNAYRNYNTNTSALAKNLEKLSSGYKINRAGDDAAGLAISEKMRAQITGLNAAQKNVKDGISLVKTAEGAMQEIQDMLNRMDYLATQSANGTYDNEVDRKALQKEVDQLRSEINRIADSANFNGIYLLNGKTAAVNSNNAAGELLSDLNVDGAKASEAGKAEATITFGKVASSDSSSNTGEPTKLEYSEGDSADGVDPTASSQDKATFTLDSTSTTFDSVQLTGTLSSLVTALEAKGWTIEVDGKDNTADSIAAGDKVTLTRIATGESGDDENDIKGLFVFDDDGADSLEITLGSDVGGGVTGTKASYEIEIDLSKLQGGQQLVINGKVIEFTINGSNTGGSGVDGDPYYVDISSLDADTVGALLDSLLVTSNFDFIDGTSDGTWTVSSTYQTSDDPSKITLTFTAYSTGSDQVLNFGDIVNSDADDIGIKITPTPGTDDEDGSKGVIAKAVFQSDDLKTGSGAALEAGATIKIGSTTITVVDDGDEEEDTDVGASDVVDAIKAALQKEYGGKWNVEYDDASGEITVSAKQSDNTKAADIAKEISISIGLPEEEDTSAADTGESQSFKIGEKTITFGQYADPSDSSGQTMKNDTVADLLAALDELTLGDAKLSDYFDITITDKDGNELGDTDNLEVGTQVKFEAKRAGKLGDDVMALFDQITDTSETPKKIANVKAGWDEGQNSSGNNTHYTLDITTSKLAGGQSFSFGTGDKVYTFEFDLNNETTVNGSLGDEKNTEVGDEGRTKITFGANWTDEQIAAEIEKIVGGAMKGYTVSVTSNGGTISLDITADKPGEEWNLGQVRCDTEAGSMEGTYEPYNEKTAGTPGTYAQVTWEFDISKLAEGDKVKIGNTEVEITDKLMGADGKTVDADKLIDAFESANGGEFTGRISIDTEAGTLTVTGNKFEEKAADLAEGEGKLSVTLANGREETSGGLVLQIGDTSDNYNKLTVTIGDMHTYGAMGIDDINIESADGAAAAIDVIKNAINYVSSIRGDLGATQNRLEHTANNLSVMAENIQDAESTIRDTDVAEEMMAYTKNNILIQSAQAMLAQANAIPQGVLQLLG